MGDGSGGGEVEAGADNSIASILAVQEAEAAQAAQEAEAAQTARAAQNRENTHPTQEGRPREFIDTPPPPQSNIRSGATPENNPLLWPGFT